MAYWLVKSEPSVYSWEQLVEDKQTCWSGIRNYAARLNLRAMKNGDEAFFYHSNEGMAIVGIATIIKEAYRDPTTEDERWVAVDVKSKRKLNQPVTLQQIKNEPGLVNMELVRLGRLSTQKVTEEEWKKIMSMAEEK